MLTASSSELLLASIHILDAVSLILKRRVVGADARLPAVILTLILVRNYIAANASSAGCW